MKKNTETKKSTKIFDSEFMNKPFVDLEPLTDEEEKQVALTRNEKLILVLFPLSAFYYCHRYSLETEDYEGKAAFFFTPSMPPEIPKAGQKDYRRHKAELIKLACLGFALWFVGWVLVLNILDALA